jgi:hypothetical protein
LKNALEAEYNNPQIEHLKLDKAKQAVKAERDRPQTQRLEILSRLQEFNNELSPESVVKT